MSNLCAAERDREAPKLHREYVLKHAVQAFSQHRQREEPVAIKLIIAVTICKQNLFYSFKANASLLLFDLNFKLLSYSALGAVNCICLHGIAKKVNFNLILSF